MSRRRKVIESTALLILVEEVDEQAHADLRRRGGYLRLLPGQVPEIVLDGLADAKERRQAEARLRRELELILLERQLAQGETERDPAKRRVVRISPRYVLTSQRDPDVHNDPARRGAYLIQEANKLPEIVLDELATPEEQRRAEERFARELDHDAFLRLRGLVHHARRLTTPGRPPRTRK